MKNPVNWFEIATIDLERAKNFYGIVFDTQFEFVDMPGSPMYMFAGNPEGPNAMGALVKSEDNLPSIQGTIVYFTCDDLAVEEKRVVENGGKIISPKYSIGEFGFVGLFEDTEGNKIGLHSEK